MLDSHKTYAAYDPDGVGFQIEHLAEQVRMAWRDSRGVALPSRYKKVSRVLVVALGSSALSAELLASAFTKKLSVPVDILRSYALPLWVGKDTLIVLLSFSGSTEEVLSVAHEARRRRLTVAVCTTGGALAEIAADAKWPIIHFTSNEFAGEARYGQGFSSMSVLGILRAAGLCSVQDDDVRRMRQAMGDVLDTCAVDVPTKDNPAKTVAEALVGRTVFVVGTEHLTGNTRIFQDQIHTSAKQFAFSLPELNNHFLEAFTFPKNFVKNITIVMLRSAHYDARIQKRFDVIAEVFETMGMEVVDYVAGGKDAIEECAEVLQFSSFVSYYLAMCNKINPRNLPVVTAFKKRL